MVYLLLLASSVPCARLMEIISTPEEFYHVSRIVSSWGASRRRQLRGGKDAEPGKKVKSWRSWRVEWKRWMLSVRILSGGDG